MEQYTDNLFLTCYPSLYDLEVAIDRKGIDNEFWQSFEFLRGVSVDRVQGKKLAIDNKARM